MKGIILAAGLGTRLHPSTISVSKQLLPIYDKPMIYYPLSLMMLSNIREILIITSEASDESYKLLLGDGNHLGISISYKIQYEANGIADGLLLGEEFIGDSNFCLMLGDNIFYGNGLREKINSALSDNSNNNGATIFGYLVNNPRSFGVAELNKEGKVISIEEKPQNPKSNLAVTGLYIFDNTAIKKAKSIKPSNRGELEITDVIQLYIDENKCNISVLGRGIAWLDTGTHDMLLSASNFVQAIEQRQGYKIACVEEVAYRQGYISKETLLQAARKYEKSGYGLYLQTIIHSL